MGAAVVVLDGTSGARLRLYRLESRPDLVAVAVAADGRIFAGPSTVKSTPSAEAIRTAQRGQAQSRSRSPSSCASSKRPACAAR